MAATQPQPAPSTGRPTRPPADSDDTGAAPRLLTIFIAAALMVINLVAMIAMVRTWWMFGVTFAIEVVVTAIVIATIIRVMSGRANQGQRPSGG